MYMSSLKGVSNLRSFGGNIAKVQFSDCPTNSLWFERFSRGCLSRMGQVVKQDMAISLGVMHAMLSLLNEAWKGAQGGREQSHIANVGAYISIAFCGSFRGAEVFLVDLFGLKKYAELGPSYGSREYVIIPLLGRLRVSWE